jgi:hypothetical protein
MIIINFQKSHIQKDVRNKIKNCNLTHRLSNMLTAALRILLLTGKYRIGLLYGLFLDMLSGIRHTIEFRKQVPTLINTFK